MKKYFGSLAAVCLLFAGLGFAAPSAATAQDHANGATMPPNVLVIMREYLKPGKSGSVHEKSESAFVQAFGQAKEQTHYLAMNALSGKSRALFFLGYDNFAEWGQDNEAMMKNSALAGAVDSAMQSDGELLSSYDSGVFTLNKDLSLRPMTVVGRIHYFEVDAFVVRPGKDRQFEELSKMYRDAYQKIPNVKWVAYEGRYGSNANLYLFITPMTSIAEIDQERIGDKQFTTDMAMDQMKKMEDMETETVVSHKTNLFAVSPKMSYPRDTWKQADPEFWGQK
jgi:hypothetical protein